MYKRKIIQHKTVQMAIKTVSEKNKQRKTKSKKRSDGSLVKYRGKSMRLYLKKLVALHLSENVVCSADVRKLHSDPRPSFPVPQLPL